MNQPVIQSPVVPSAEPVARPKVLRRPANFARPAQSAEILPLTDVRIDFIPAPLPPEALPRAAQPWQEDGRFGLALLIAVILINLLVVLALTHRAEPATVTGTPPVITTPESSSGEPFVNVLDDRALPVRE